MLIKKSLLLRVHRWTALAFSLPLAAVIFTGLILSVEPIVTQAVIEPGAIGSETLVRAVEKADPQGAARVLFVRPRDGVVSVGTGRGAPPVEVDLRSGEPKANPGPSGLAAIFGTARRVHEHLVFGAGWLVTASTIAMLVLVALGVFMGWPRLRNSLSGWHKGLGWLPLPLLIASPLTGLLMAFGLTLSPATPRPKPDASLSLVDAVRVLGASHDLSRLLWIRPIGGGLVARIYEDGEARTYALSRTGAAPLPRNWPRLLHEGTWGGILPSILNMLTAAALIGLLGTGVAMWLRRRTRARRAPAAAPEDAKAVGAS